MTTFSFTYRWGVATISILATGFLVWSGTHTAAAAKITYEHVPMHGHHGDFVVGPGKVELIIEPGTTRTAELIVTNRLGDEREFTLSVEDATGSHDPNEAIVLLGEDQGPYTLKDYISFPADRITLDHGGRARIPVTISVPEDAEPSGRYGSVLVSVISKAQEDGAPAGAAPRSAVVSRIGALFFVTVPGEIVTEGSLKEFATIPAMSVIEEGPIRFEVLYENTGSIHLNPYGTISITNMFGETVGVIELEPWYAMPESLRFREAIWSREHLFGFYTATLDLHLGYDGLTDSREISFYVIPWGLISTGLIGLIVSVFVTRFLWRFVRRTRRSAKLAT